MLNKFSTHKSLSLILSTSVLFGTLFGGLSALAEDTTEVVAHSCLNVSYSGASNDTYQEYSDIDFAEFGTNMIPDSTVSQFEEGVYKEYYNLDVDDKGGKVLNPDAWWDHAASRYLYFYESKDAYASMKKSGSISSDTTLSHTDDGSGVLNYNTKSTDAFLPLPSMESDKYYLITMWVKLSTFNTTITTGIKDFSNNEDVLKSTEGSYKTPYNNPVEWRRYTYIYYTGSKARTETSLYFRADQTGYIDDVMMYELDSAYATKCIESGKLLTKKDLLPDEGSAVCVTNATDEGVYFGGFGENLIPDSTVSQFNEDGTYKSYYDLDTDSTGGAVLDSNAWWDKAGNRYQYFFNNSNAYGSMNKLGYCSNDSTQSHTNDGSGALSVPKGKQLYLPLPELEAKSYYVVTAWINPSKGTTLTTTIRNSGIQEVSKKMVLANAGWQRICWIYYTGADQQKEAILQVYSDDAAYMDDFAVYKLDDDYGTDCVANKKLSANTTLNLGDLNNDGSVDICDLVRIKQVVESLSFDYVPANAKLDGSLTVSETDLQILRKYLIGSIADFSQS